MIPAFNDYGCLPEGIYDCTIDEAADRFGTFQRTGRRPQLWNKFIRFMREVKGCGLVNAVLVDGSFATAKTEPNDIDLVLVLSPRHDFSMEFQPNAYNVLSKRRVHRRFGFDLLVARADSEEYRRWWISFNKCAWNRSTKRGY